MEGVKRRQPVDYRILTICSALQLIATWNQINYSVFFNQWTHTFHTNNKQLMLIPALHSATIGLVSPTVMHVIDRIGYRAAILLGLLVLAAGYGGGGALNHGGVSLMVFWLGFTGGIGSALVTVGTAALCARFLDDNRRLWSIMLTVAPTMGAAVRVPVLRALFERFGALNALLIWALVLLVSAVLTVPFLKRPPERLELSAKVRRQRLFSVPLMAFLLGMTLLMSFSAARELSPKYAESELGMSGTWSAWSASIGQMASLTAVLLLLVATPIVHIDGVMLSALAVNCVCSLSMALTSDPLVFVVFLSLFCSSSGVAWALFPAALAERVSHADQVPRAYGVAYGTVAVASACWGVVSGVVIDEWGSTRAYYVVTGVAICCAILAFSASLLCVRCEKRGSDSLPLAELQSLGIERLE